MDWKGNRLIIILLLSFISSLLWSQEIEQQEIDSIWWKQKTEELDYSEKELDAKNFVNSNPDLSWINNPIIKYTVLFLILAVLLFLLYKIVGKGLLNLNPEEEEKEYHLLTEDELDHRFYEMDLIKLLEDARLDQNWKGAIRIQFFIVLKHLIDTDQIRWHKDLTNLQIVFQLEEKSARLDLLSLVRSFEKVWYGDHPTSSEGYDEYRKEAEGFIEQRNSQSV